MTGQLPSFYARIFTVKLLFVGISNFLMSQYCPPEKHKNMTQMNLSMRQKQTHRHREQTCGCQRGGGVGRGWNGSLGLAEANHYI